MKELNKSLDECIELYKQYSCKCGDAICSHEKETLDYYTDKLLNLVQYTDFKYEFDLYSVDLSKVI